MKPINKLTHDELIDYIDKIDKKAEENGKYVVGMLVQRSALLIEILYREYIE